MTVLARVLRDDAGVALPEYALVLSVLSLGLLVLLSAFGTASNTTLGHQADAFVTLQTGP